MSILKRRISHTGEATPIWAVPSDGVEAWLAEQPESVRKWLQTTGFDPKAGRFSTVPGSDGSMAGVVCIVPKKIGPWSLAALASGLPEGDYYFADGIDGPSETNAAMGWQLESYSYTRFKALSRQPARLLAGDLCDVSTVNRLSSAIGLVRDLINTPANEMGPDSLADAAIDLANRQNASIEVISDQALLDQNYPMIYAVGQASARRPRLIDLKWGREDAPRLTLVGKGVCFDSGGLDLKPADNMRLMKKDMGGAANMLGLAQAVMDTGIDVRLRLLIPAVENSVSGTAFRPGDVFTARDGTTIEIGNTDAEGRLVLCDALAEADQESPDLMIDMATLTGAARVALGTEVAALFTNDDAIATELAKFSKDLDDPLWRLPVWEGYRESLKSDIADIDNAPPGRYGGAITAALFLDHFVKKTKSYAHFDVMGWNMRARPGRPKGGEAYALRALLALIQNKFA